MSTTETTAAERLREIRERAEKATYKPHVTKYDHGGGRLYLDGHLIADFYDSFNGDLFARASADIVWLTDMYSRQAARIEALEQQLGRWRLGQSEDDYEITQTLGRALGYPRYADDPKNFPDVTGDDVCVGEHVPATLASEAASEIKRLRQQLAEAGRYSRALASTIVQKNGTIEVLRSQLAEGRREWIPVEERLPAREGIYLVAAAGQVYRCYFGIPVSNPWTLEMRFYMSSVSHWMPLPDAPGTHAERGEVEK